MYKTDLWELKYFEDDEQIEIVVREPNGSYCNGFAAIPCYGEDDVNYEDQWEIARLLVASPALLKACEGLIETLETVDEDGGDSACQCMAKTPCDITPPPPCTYCFAKEVVYRAKKGHNS
jgi:hypothetical protein